MPRFQTVGEGSAQKGQEIGRQSEQRKTSKIQNKTNRTNRAEKVGGFRHALSDLSSQFFSVLFVLLGFFNNINILYMSY